MDHYFINMSKSKYIDCHILVYNSTGSRQFVAMIRILLFGKLLGNVFCLKLQSAYQQCWLL